MLDPLQARALWLSAGEADALVIAADLCVVTESLHEQIAAALQEKTGLPREALVLAASHTHSGPATFPLIGWGQPNTDYLNALARRLVDVGVAAHAARAPARIAFGHVRIEGVGINREHPRFGPTDPAAQLLRVDRDDGTPLAVAYNYAAHPVTRYPFTHRISADWPGLVNQSLRLAFDGAMPLFLQGCAGNINGHDVLFGRNHPHRLHAACDAHCGEVARRVLDRIVPALRAIDTADGEPPTIKARARNLELPCASIDSALHRRAIEQHSPEADRMTYADLRPLHERLTDETEQERRWRWARWEVDVARRQLQLDKAGVDHLDARVGVLHLGHTALVTWPAEAFVELGIELRERSEARMTLPIGYANDFIGYLPTPWAYESQGRPHQFGVYPTARTPLVLGAAPFDPQAPRLVVEQTLAMLRSDG